MAKKKKISIFDKYNRNMSDADIRKGTKKAIQWYKLVIKDNRKITPEKTIERESRRVTTKIGPGRMYLFGYDAKHKDKLPYWDRYPLIIMVGPAKGGFYGLNLHYLPYKLRLKMLGNLINIEKSAKFDDLTKMKISYSMLKATRNLRYFQPCFKHYLTSHMVTKMIQIHPQDWEMSLFMPLARFEKMGQKSVWKISRNIIGNG